MYPYIGLLPIPSYLRIACQYLSSGEVARALGVLVSTPPAPGVHISEMQKLGNRNFFPICLRLITQCPDHVVNITIDIYYDQPSLNLKFILIRESLLLPPKGRLFLIYAYSEYVNIYTYKNICTLMSLHPFPIITIISSPLSSPGRPISSWNTGRWMRVHGYLFLKR